MGAISKIVAGNWNPEKQQKLHKKTQQKTDVSNTRNEQRQSKHGDNTYTTSHIL